MSVHSSISKLIRSYLGQPGDDAIRDEITQHGLQVLPVLREFLAADLPIDKTEQIESILKVVLRQSFSTTSSGKNARKIAKFQRDLGFILKYKSYAVKASTPLGYSVFIQNEREGFSFQRHISHKTEVFHILEVKPGGFVFLCNFSDWEKHYDESIFTRWLAGEPHEFFDQHKFIPTAGDVFIVSQLNIVHSVIGCILEEYATVSTDMVDRLHDQNRGKPIPSHFTRSWAFQQLRVVSLPEQNRVIDLLSNEPKVASLRSERVYGGERTILQDSLITASTYALEPHAEGELAYDSQRAVILRVASGCGVALIGEKDELDYPGEIALACSTGDILLVPPGVYFQFKNETDKWLKYSEHRISVEVAFI